MWREGSIPYGGRIRRSTAPSASCSWRKASRMQRLIRLRSTARAACFFDTRMPSRGTPASRLSRKKLYPARLCRVPWRSKRSNCALCVSRRARSSPKRWPLAATARGAAGPWRAGCGALHGRRVCRCAPGNHGAAHAASWRVGKSASLPSPGPKKGGIRARTRFHCQIHNACVVPR
jgi:hypothetical protein